MFGTPLVEKGYDQAAEWIEILEKLYASDQPLDYEGTYYRLKEAVSRPASLQVPRPVTMNAAFGGPGRDFAAARCDYLFTTFSEMSDAGKHVADISERADKVGRNVGVYTVAHVVCRPTMEEAQAYYTAMPSIWSTTMRSMLIWQARRSSRSRMTRMPMTATGSVSPAAPAPTRWLERRKRLPPRWRQ
ncbi:hypothetical protein X767_04060 [Mesorhizobium sp. LSJC264A00]|nr:LLM class flavin-dependent oxidoreductase [Mesorhizobium sp. LSJC264A00]ESX27284.1 hypothetical protein X767_04060 [Mesorhizobium sp. LSJC264A00]